MTYENEILTFLSKPENIEISLEISEYVEKIKPYLLEKFWLTFANTLRSRLNQSDYYDTWEIMDSFHNGILQSYTTCSISPFVPGMEKINLLSVSLQHSTPQKSYSLHYGIGWTKNPVREKNLGVEELYKVLPSNQQSNTDWWPSITYTHYSIYGKEGLIRLATNPDDFVAEIADLVWDFFVRLEPTLSNINHQLIQEEQK